MSEEPGRLTYSNREPAVAALERLLTAEQVAEALQVRVRYVYELVRRGSLPCVRLGQRKVRFRAEDVNAFVDAVVDVSPGSGLDAGRRAFTRSDSAAGQRSAGIRPRPRVVAREGIEITVKPKRQRAPQSPWRV